MRALAVGSPCAGYSYPPVLASGPLRFFARMSRQASALRSVGSQTVEVGATPFLLAAKAADVELMRVLVASGADPLRPTKEHTTPLMTAAGVGIWNVGESPGTNEAALDAVKLCLELGGDVTAVNDNGYTALHGAAHRGSPALVQFLVDKGARLDAKLTKSGGGNVGWQAGWTPLAITEGVFYANTFKRSLETAALLRQLMNERGVPVEQPVATSPPN